MHQAPQRLALLAVFLAVAGCASQPRAGASASVRFGVVRTAEPTILDANAASGAMVGGRIGLVSGSGRRGSARNVMVGTSVGIPVGAPAVRRGVSYTVDMGDGSAVRIVSDQIEIRPGDCVAVEQVRSTANIRRTSERFCDAQNARAIQEVQSSSRAEAAHCAAAKDELVRAATTEEIDLATRKIELLCDG
jgi:hypothetical protein